LSHLGVNVTRGIEVARTPRHHLAFDDQRGLDRSGEAQEMHAIVENQQHITRQAAASQ
jgi:hypothetical protein